MSTRGFIGFVIDGVEKISYNHYDSYPEHLGEIMRDFVAGDGIEAKAEAARSLRVVSPDSEPTDADIEQLRQYAYMGVGSNRSGRPDWYQLLHETMGNPAATLIAGVMLDGSDFPSDSLFAEWGYVVDFDAKTFEVYRGFQRTAHDRGRFAGRLGRDGYHPCALAASWPLSELPSDEDFIAALEESDDES